MTATEFDQAAADAFAGRLLQIVNDGMLCLMVSIGHRTGLFDTLAAAPPLTSAQLAERAGLHERYVREWLGAMVTGQLVDYDPATMTYALPAGRAAFLTRAAGVDNIALQTQYIALLGTVEDQIVACFRDGGGVPYAAFADFQRLMAEDSGTTFDAKLLEVTLPLVDGLTDRLRAGIDVADVGCGSGHALNLMAAAFPASRFTGYDFSDEGLGRGRAEAAQLGLANVRFEPKDVATLDVAARYDLITTFDAIHDQARPALVLAAIRKALRPGGVYLCVDVAASSDLAKNRAHPLGPMLYTLSTMHCMTVSLALGGAGLGTVWGRELALEMLAAAGFTKVDVRTVEGDIFNAYYVARP
ncbi:MAG: class I SAM-dependent methyltransferase [Candidatus Limnocylindria bacterium]